MKNNFILLAAVYFIVSSVIVPFGPNLVHAQAQSIKIELAAADDVKSILNKIGNKPVTLVLLSDKEISGKISNITDRLIHLTDLAGKDYYDAIVKIENIQAVIIRAR